ncbi:MAG: phospho-sugar mutase [Hydrogenibacillus sp.]|nr:phospho-sugar mutase [Hydrogenibacillus sp.]
MSRPHDATAAETIRTVSRRRYREWLQAPLSAEMRAELQQLQDAEIVDRFYRHLAFGTGGMRGELGAGTNRMNVYVVRRATAGLARYLKATVEARNKTPSVVIAYDSRRMSRAFAEAAAEVLAAHGVIARLFPDVTPTPELSFAVRHLGADAGIVITASHNPPEYNGYKVYGADGGQITPAFADRLMAEIAEIEDVFSVPAMPVAEGRQKGLIRDIDPAVESAYIERIAGLVVRPDIVRDIGNRLVIVYTPLHGTGARPVMAALRAAGFTNVHLVDGQAAPDGAFPTVRVPNPEEPDAFALAIETAKRLNADIALATDPDVDRVGAAVRTPSGDYVLLNGNTLGALMLDYLVTQRAALGTLPENGAVVKTIVTAELGRKIAERHGLTVIDVLTGFKFIGEKIGEFERTGAHTFVFGYEESYGYLAGDFVRDKDAVQAVVLLAEVAAYHKAHGRTLLEAVDRLFAEYGAHVERLVAMTLKGPEGAARIGRMMADLRDRPPETVGARPVVERQDYLAGLAVRRESDGKWTERRLTLPASDVLKYVLDDGSWVAVRPSGTEPKIKIYAGAVAETKAEAEGKADALVAAVVERLETV